MVTVTDKQPTPTTPSAPSEAQLRRLAWSASFGLGGAASAWHRAARDNSARCATAVNPAGAAATANTTNTAAAPRPRRRRAAARRLSTRFA